MSGGVQEPPLVAMGPIRHAPAAVGEKFRLRTPVVPGHGIGRGIESPELASLDRIERDEFGAGQGGVHHAVYDEWIALHLAPLLRTDLAGAKGPSRCELVNVRGVD